MIQTVNGPIDPNDLGVTLAHEHLLIDLTCLLEDETGSTGAWNRPIGDVPRAHLESHPYRWRDNLLLDDEETAAAELRLYRSAGGASVIDLTVAGIGPNPLALRRISHRTGVHVIAGAGVYRALAHPSWVHAETVSDLSKRFIRAIEEGIDGTDVRAGVLGELGTSSPIHPDEVKVLQAAARAQVDTDVPINVHCALFDKEGMRILDILEDAGGDLRRVALSHMDELLDFDYHRQLAQRGAWLSFDTFGSELPLWNHREPTDEERIEHLGRMIDAGFAEQILISQDICSKMQLRRYGGKGYANVLTSIVPQLERPRIPARTIRQMLVDNPRRYVSPAR